MKSILGEFIREWVDDANPKITAFRGNYAFLSNFYVHLFTYKGIEFKTSEHAYQWEKAETALDKTRILMSLTPTIAKRIGHDIKVDIKHWDSTKLQKMTEILIAKFSDPILSSKLAKTGDAELVEGNTWDDTFWGSCSCKKCEGKPHYNHLGKILMKIRKNHIA